VQRQPSAELHDIDTIGSRDAGQWVQRVTEAQPASGQSAEKGKGSAPDLDLLARQIYPILKRMLAVERERRSGH